MSQPGDGEKVESCLEMYLVGELDLEAWVPKDAEDSIYLGLDAYRAAGEKSKKVKRQVRSEEKANGLALGQWNLGSWLDNSQHWKSSMSEVLCSYQDSGNRPRLPLHSSCFMQPAFIAFNIYDFLTMDFTIR